MADQCYHNGDFYQCITATAAGESPTTTPASWARVRIPRKFRWVLAQLTYAHLLELDGQLDKALVVRERALAAQRIGLDALIRAEYGEEANRTRPHVKVCH